MCVCVCVCACVCACDTTSSPGRAMKNSVITSLEKKITHVTMTTRFLITQ